MAKNTTIEELYSIFLLCNQQISTDTRKLIKGSLFFALKGENFNANAFALSAIEQGCSYAIVDDNSIQHPSALYVKNVLESLQELAKHHRAQLQIPIIGITGSNAKTTHKELINAVLSKKYNVYATVGNLNNHIGVPLTLLSINNTHQIAIIEMGANHQGEIALLSDIANPEYGIITNIGKAHLEGFGGVEGIKKGKSELYKHIKSNNGKLFINGDDAVLLDLANDIEKIYYGTNFNFNVHGQLIKDSDYVTLQWNKKNNDYSNQPIVKTKLFGDYNFINILCAVCVGSYFNVDEDKINEALQEYTPEMNRSQTVVTKSNKLILDAYNANPSSMKLAIENFQQNNHQHKVVILGDMFELGEFSHKEHQEVITNVNNCGFEMALFVGKHFYDFKNEFKHFLFFNTTEDLNYYLKNNSLIDKMLLIKGSRGVKLEQIVEFL